MFTDILNKLVQRLCDNVVYLGRLCLVGGELPAHCVLLWASFLLKS